MMILTQLPPPAGPPPPPGLEINHEILALLIVAILYGVFIIINTKNLNFK
ncbi:hypothetical protein [Polaribacter sp. 11A2H]|nr:hypothetical protein [Polaribacter sp. 11A2H]